MQSQFDDLLSFAESAIKIKNSNHEISPFVPNPHQSRMLQSFADHPFLCAIVGRQIGSTTCNLVFSLWYALLNPRKRIIFTSTSTLLSLIKKDALSDIIEQMNAEDRPNILENRRQHITFSNGSSIDFLKCSKNIFIGIDPDLVIFDDFAAVDESSARMTIEYYRARMRDNARCIITSFSPQNSSHPVRVCFNNFGFVGQTYPREDSPELREQIGREAYAREIDAKFVEDDGRIIDPETMQEVLS